MKVKIILMNIFRKNKILYLLLLLIKKQENILIINEQNIQKL